MISNDTLKRLTTLTPSGQWTDEAQLKHRLASELLMERQIIAGLATELKDEVDYCSETGGNDAAKWLARLQHLVFKLTNRTDMDHYAIAATEAAK